MQKALFKEPRREGKLFMLLEGFFFSHSLSPQGLFRNGDAPFIPDLNQHFRAALS